MVFQQLNRAGVLNRGVSCVGWLVVYEFIFWNFLLLFSDYVVNYVINERFKLEMTADAGLYFFIEYTKLYCYFYRTTQLLFRSLFSIINFDRNICREGV